MEVEPIIVRVDPDLADLVPEFLENRRRDVEEIKRLLVRGDMEEIRRLGHIMKGAGGGYGFEKISEIGRGIEEAAKRGDQETVLAWNEKLASYLTLVKVVVEG